MKRKRFLLVIALGALWLGRPPAADAQEDCEFLTGADVTDEVSDMGDIVFMRRPRLGCRDGMRVSADSAFLYKSSRLYQFYGRTSFENAEVSLTARDAQYYVAEARITAQGGARLLRKEDGSLVTGDAIELLQRTDQRPEEQLTVTGGRPHAVFTPKQREGAPPDTAGPFEVDGDRIFLRGEEMQASGNAQLRRGELEGSANELQYIGTPGQLLLRGNASLFTDAYDLTGGLILLQMPDGQVEEVTAREGATFLQRLDRRGDTQDSQRLKFEAPLIYFILEEGELERLVGGRDAGWVPPDTTVRMRPIATAEDFSITGDSLEVTAPGGDLEAVLAMGRAHATSSAGDIVVTDLSPEIAREDWIEGDTILATFAREGPDTTSVAPAVAEDTTSAEPEFRLERLRARVEARALYRMPVTDTTGAPGADTAAAAPAAEGDCIAFHYVTGREITIFLEEGAVTSMEVEEALGTHLEPPCGRTAPPPTPAPPDAPAPPPPGNVPPPVPPPGPAHASARVPRL